MSSKQTLEVRWFECEQIPSKIQQWFLHDGLGKLEQNINTPEEREDYYLYLPECHLLSIKLSRKNLEIKWRKDELGIVDLLAIQGRVERWLKIDYTQDRVKNLFLSDNKQNQIFLKVNKKRWQRDYQQVEFELGYLEIGQTCWWTLAAEMEETDNNDAEKFRQTIQEFSQNYSQIYSGQNLSAEKSYAYPSWLLHNFSA